MLPGKTSRQQRKEEATAHSGLCGVHHALLYEDREFAKTSEFDAGQETGMANTAECRRAAASSLHYCSDPFPVNIDGQLV